MSLDLDGFVEGLGRWTAGRSTRRSFLGRLGRGAVLVAGGPTMAVLLAERAEARVCGQSGVAPKCATFDCDATWGWCWYASGCCADGSLKKICDCCAPNTPHPVGYCPSGTRVKCIVESCGADPRLQTRTITRLRDRSGTALSIAASQTRYPTGTDMLVIGDADDPVAAAVAVSLGGVAEGPVLLSPRSGLDETLRAEIARVGPVAAIVAGPALPRTVDQHLTAAGITHRRVGTSTDARVFAAEAGLWSRQLSGSRTAILVDEQSDVHALAGAAGIAAARRWPLLVGGGSRVEVALAVPRAVRRVHVVGPDPAAANGYEGGSHIPVDLPGLADHAVRLGMDRARAGLFPLGSPHAAAGMAAFGGPLLGYVPGTLDGARDWLFAHRPAMQAAFVAGDVEEFGDEPYYELQSILNEYETHLLRGRSGEGLPVISQPRDERPIGQARR